VTGGWPKPGSGRGCTPAVARGGAPGTGVGPGPVTPPGPRTGRSPRPKMHRTSSSSPLPLATKQPTSPSITAEMRAP